MQKSKLFNISHRLYKEHKRPTTINEKMVQSININLPMWFCSAPPFHLYKNNTWSEKRRKSSKRKPSLTSTNYFQLEETTKQGSIIRRTPPPLITRKQFKQVEKMELECIKEGFLRNQVMLQGRRRAITDVDLLNSLGQIKKNIKFRPFFLRDLFTKWFSSKKNDDLDLKEMRRIVSYQIQPKRRISI